jgi:hypothetical protein
MRKAYILSFLLLIGCATTGYNPNREISLAEAAVAAAKEVHAERLASDKYQFAVEWLGKARAYKEKGKTWSAKRAAKKAVFYAEEAEEISTMKLSQVPYDSDTQELESIE